MPIPENIHANVLPTLGQPLGGGKFATIYWLNGVEYALIDLGVTAEIEGAWGEFGQNVQTNHGDGGANTRAMAAAGSAIAAQAQELGAFIPSAMECHLLLHAKETGVVDGLREDCWYWSSSQYSANTAYGMDFEDGWQYGNVKGYERPVRLVRKIPVIR